MPPLGVLKNARAARRSMMGRFFAAQDGKDGAEGKLAVLGGLDGVTPGKEELLSIGRMAALNCVSEKTLHLYQRKGIVEPCYVDPATGYRYYSLDQCAVLDAVTQLQSLGFSLDEIRDALHSADPQDLRGHIERHLKELQRQRCELEIAEAFAHAVLDACDLCTGGLVCDQIMFERMPDRYGLVFSIEPFSPPDFGNVAWERGVRQVKQELFSRGYPPALFQQVSGIIGIDDLKRGSLVTRKAVIFLDPAVAHALDEPLTLIPGGQYLVTNFEYALDKNDLSPEYPAIVRMMEYAERQGFELAGDYIGETVASTPVFGYQGINSFFRCELPVRRKG